MAFKFIRKVFPLSMSAEINKFLTSPLDMKYENNRSFVYTLTGARRMPNECKSQPRRVSRFEGREKLITTKFAFAGKFSIRGFPRKSFVNTAESLAKFVCSSSRVIQIE